ncbi:sulfite exporter TauE/SafE family protein [Pollutibacter soli]|uniref:sulfite exporter TauE/SafE family protein n=1 Tax=Pollutibacter soli TaxID=3034157 RepID=UPI003013C396
MDIVFYVLLFIVAFLYSAVGHGGASGYLALMALYGVAPETMKPAALLLNLFVSLTSFIQYYRGRHFMFKIFLPLALASIPMAFLGGLVSIDASIYKKMLGVLLLIPALRFLVVKSDISEAERKQAVLWISILIGAAIGYLSGLIGIGGGILLSPILILLKWTNQKQTAAISALFIFVNSFSGLAGQITKGIQFNNDIFVYVVIAFAGGLCGAYFGALKFKSNIIQYLLSAVLLIAAYKLIFASN